MKKLIVAAFAALALIGCTPDKAEKVPSAAPPETVQVTALPAPQPIAVTIADIDACKDAWASAWAAEHRTTVAAAERYARRISTTPPTTLRINGQDYVFGARNKGATVWSTCEASLKAARAAPAHARPVVQGTANAALISSLRTENQRLTYENRFLKGMAYQNPRETDPAKLIPYQSQVTDLQRRLDDQSGFTVMHGFWIVFGLLVGIGLGLYLGAKRWRRRTTRFGGHGSP